MRPTIFATSYSELCVIPSFRRYVCGQSFSMAGDAICLAALPIALINSGYDAATFGIIMACVGLGTFIGAGLGGSWTEYFSARTILIITDLVRGICQLVAAAVIAGMTHWLWLAAVYLCFGLGIGGSRPAAHVMLVELVPSSKLIAANSWLAFLDNSIAVLLPATMGVMLILTNPLWGVVIDGITFMIAASLTSFVPVTPPVDRSHNEASERTWLRGFRIIDRIPPLKLGLRATLVINVLCFPVFLVVAPYTVADRFSDSLWGLSLAASGLGACLGAITAVVTYAHLRITILCAFACLALTLAMCLIAVGDAMTLILLGAVLIGFVEGIWLTAWATVMQMHSPAPDLGIVVGTETALTSGIHPFIYLGGGSMGASIGYDSTLSLTALASLGALLLILFGALKSSRKSRA